MRITTAVICAAGAGTRLLPATKEQPKEMLPLFAPSAKGALTLKPLVQLVFEQLYDVGIRDFCFVIGRGKRSIADHFTPDRRYVSTPERNGDERLMADLADFYRRLDDSNLTWVNQARPVGFGHAVLQAQKVVGDQSFLVHAGDTYIISPDNIHLKRMMTGFYEQNPEAIFLLKRMSDVRRRGIAETTMIGENMFLVQRVEEKPDHPFSNLAIEPVYIFRRSIFGCLQELRPGRDNEVQLTDGIQLLVESGKRVVAVGLTESDLRLDIGNPESYWEALRESFTASQRVLNSNEI